MPEMRIHRIQRAREDWGDGLRHALYSIFYPFLSKTKRNRLRQMRRKNVALFGGNRFFLIFRHHLKIRDNVFDNFVPIRQFWVHLRH